MTEAVDVPEGLRYTKDHEWVRVEGDSAVVGITHHAQQALGDVTYVELPPEGTAVKASEELAAVESAKAAADVYAPLSGTVAEVNATLEDTPQKVNQDPYGAGWLCKLKGVDPAEADGLLSAEAYRSLLEQSEA